MGYHMASIRKKRVGIGILAAIFAVCLFVGCGGETETTLNKMKVENYVTLGDYRNLAVSVEKPVVRDEDCDQLLLAVYQSNVTLENGGVLDRPVAEGDTVNIDYVGTKDGVAFGGGTAYGTNLTIGSGGFIPGFESGLVGAMPGETRELNLTFPEDYKNSAELAGQAVVFTVTVNFIQPGMEDLRDSVVAALEIDGVANVQELRQYVYDYLSRNAEQQYLDSIEKIALSMNTTPDMYANYYFGMNSEDYAFLYGEVQARQELMLQAIANQEGWTVSDDELDGLISDYALENGYNSAEDLEAEISREQLRNFFMSERVMGHLVDMVNDSSQGAE